MTDKGISNEKDALIDSADAGDEQACLILANHYRDGDLFPKDYRKALHYYMLAAEKNNPKALCSVGMCYYKGLGTKANLQKAKEYFIRAESAGYREVAVLIEEVDRILQKEAGEKSFRERIEKEWGRVDPVNELADEKEEYDGFTEQGNEYQSDQDELEKEYLELKERFNLPPIGKKPKEQSDFPFLIVSLAIAFLIVVAIFLIDTIVNM